MASCLPAAEKLIHLSREILRTDDSPEWIDVSP